MGAVAMPELPEPIMSSPPAAPGARPDTPGVTADHETTFRFLDFLFEGVTQGWVEFQYSLPGKKPKRAAPPTFLSLPLDRDHLLKEVLSRDDRHVISFGPAPRPLARRGRQRARRAASPLRLGLH